MCDVADPCIKVHEHFVNYNFGIESCLVTNFNYTDIAYITNCNKVIGFYNSVITVSNRTDFSFNEDFIPGATYYFALTAHDLNGNRSDYSNEVSAVPR